MNWMSVPKILEKETIIMTHKIINTKTPQHLHYKMCEKYTKGQNLRETRRTGQGKLGNTPKNTVRDHRVLGDSPSTRGIEDFESRGFP